MSDGDSESDDTILRDIEDEGTISASGGVLNVEERSVVHSGDLSSVGVHGGAHLDPFGLRVGVGLVNALNSTSIGRSVGREGDGDSFSLEVLGAEGVPVGGENEDVGAIDGTIKVEVARGANVEALLASTVEKLESTEDGLSSAVDSLHTEAVLEGSALEGPLLKDIGEGPVAEDVNVGGEARDVGNDEARGIGRIVIVVVETRVVLSNVEGGLASLLTSDAQLLDHDIARDVIISPISRIDVRGDKVELDVVGRGELKRLGDPLKLASGRASNLETSIHTLDGFIRRLEQHKVLLLVSSPESTVRLIPHLEIPH